MLRLNNDKSACQIHFYCLNRIKLCDESKTKCNSWSTRGLAYSWSTRGLYKNQYHHTVLSPCDILETSDTTNISTTSQVPPVSRSKTSSNE
eukprot:scaffold102189_cov64-Attheya_sp.AAC.11